MAIEFDPAKDELNRAKHGISLARAAELEDPIIALDQRFPYSEERFRAWGLIAGSPYRLAFTTRGDKIRAISLRRAHDKEYRRYVTQEGH